VVGTGRDPLPVAVSGRRRARRSSAVALCAVAAGIAVPGAAAQSPPGLPGPAAQAVTQVTAAVAPVTEAARPVADAVAPVTSAFEPATHAVPPAIEAARPVTDAVAPVADAVRPVTDAVRPVTDAAGPLTDELGGAVSRSTDGPPSTGDLGQAPEAGPVPRRATPRPALKDKPRASAAPGMLPPYVRRAAVAPSSQVGVTSLTAARYVLEATGPPGAGEDSRPATILGLSLPALGWAASILVLLLAAVVAGLVVVRPPSRRRSNAAARPRVPAPRLTSDL
jgi:hypothetical protein